MPSCHSAATHSVLIGVDSFFMGLTNSARVLISSGVVVFF